jgi:hypothetical protein
MLLDFIKTLFSNRSAQMNHSLHRADYETHVRIVATALAAGIAVVIGALNMKFDRIVGSGVWAHAGVIKASRHAVYSISEHPFIR